MKTMTKAQMREADRRCIQVLGIPGAVLMNNAGAAVFQEIKRGPVGIVCGKGNNGGDGFVVARYCLAAGFLPFVVLVAEKEDIHGDAALFMNIYERMGGTIQVASDERAAEDAVSGLAHCACVVDALLGTGTRGEVLGAFRAAINAWPKAPAVAIDLPSGMDADTGKPLGACVKAGCTVTLQCAKEGFSASWAGEYLGRLVVADIGIPPVCTDDAAWAELALEEA